MSLATEQRAQLRAMVSVAFDVIPAVWPLGRFIATNPLSGFEHLPFRDAVRQMTQRTGARGYWPETHYQRLYAAGKIRPEALDAALRQHFPSATPEIMTLLHTSLVEPRREATAAPPTPKAVAQVNERMITWCSAFLDEGEAGWAMPYRKHGFYAAWRRLARFEQPNPVPAELEAEDALATALVHAGVERSHWKACLADQALALPGWAGFAKWRAMHPQNPAQQAAPFDPLQYLAVRLSYAVAFGAPVPQAAIEPADPYANQSLSPQLDHQQRSEIWLLAHELTTREHIVRELTRPDSSTPPPEIHADAVFCLDVRSEGVRRHLESVGPYRTHGFAGFFGLPIALRTPDSTSTRAACPVLLSPKHLIVERLQGSASALHSDRKKRGWLARAEHLLRTLKSNPVTPFVLFESIGLFFSIGLLGRTLFPQRFARLSQTLRKRLLPALATDFVLESTRIDKDVSGFTPSEQAFFAESALTLLGMRTTFSPLVVFVGHGSTSTNNAFAAALDCGACAGSRGGPNARILAALLNRVSVRLALAARGIQIPAHTLFLAAEHDTSRDQVQVFDADTIPTSHAAILQRFQHDASKALARYRTERQTALAPRPRNQWSADIQSRAVDWAQVRPEWGLAKNATFVIGPRAFSRQANLENRAFFHEYAPEDDADGAILEIIMTAPLVVAQWINSHYYFATVDNERYGSGNKVIHQIVGRIGVMSGNRSDLRAGLPLQSLADAHGWYHEPLRLLTIITAPRARIRAVLARNPHIQHLFHNGWMSLMAWDTETQHFWTYHSDASWHPYQPLHEGATGCPCP